ncbi:unnamed protein product, partial [Prorocentrum cordatum]
SVLGEARLRRQAVALSRHQAIAGSPGANSMQRWLGKTLRRQPVSNRSGPAARRQQRFRRGRRPGAPVSGREDSDARKGNGKNWHNAQQHMLSKTEGEEEEEEEEGMREGGGEETSVPADTCRLDIPP